MGVGDHDNLVSLREHLLKLIETQAKTEELKWEAFHREQSIRDENLMLQAKEYERRLTNLNHEAEQLKRIHEKYLPREMYMVEHKELARQSLNISDRLGETDGKLNALSSHVNSISASLTWFIRLVAGSAVLGFLGYMTRHLMK